MEICGEACLQTLLAVRSRIGVWTLMASLAWFACPAVTAQTAAESAQLEAPVASGAPLPESSPAALPDAPAARDPQSESFIGAVGGAAKTIGQDEWHLIKAPFHKKAIVWDALFLGATGVLIANDESVLYAIPVQWHSTNREISNGALYGTAAVAGGIYLTGLFTKNEHAQEAGIRTAEATVDSVILYGAMKAIFQRQRPYSGPGEGKFFAGNWSNGSFPSGHAMFTWTIASTIAHQYHSIPLDIMMYGMASTVTTTRVLAGQHFPSDVFVGSVLGYLIGDYIAHKEQEVRGIRASKMQKVRNALLEHVDIGVE
jgi:membrane-associated phospholipid phosphatase